MSAPTASLLPTTTTFEWYAVWSERAEPRSTGPFRTEEAALEHARKRALIAHRAHGYAADALSAAAVRYSEWAQAHQVTVMEIMLTGSNLVALGVVDSPDGRCFVKVTRDAGDSQWCTCGGDRCEHQAALRRVCEGRGWRVEQ